MARTKPGAEREGDLLDAAQALFVERGVRGTTLEDITRAAGVAKGTFYLYFRSKEAVVRALQERYSARFGQRLARAVTAEATWGGKLDALVDTWDATYAAEAELHDILYHHVAAADEGLPASAVLAVIDEVLAAGVAEGAFEIDDVASAALLIYSALHGAFEADPGGMPPAGRGRIVQTAKVVLRRAVGMGTSG